MKLRRCAASSPPPALHRRLLRAVGTGLPGLRRLRPDPAAAEPDRRRAGRARCRCCGRMRCRRSTPPSSASCSACWRHRDRCRHRLVEARLRRHLSAAGRLLAHPKVAVVPIFVVWFGAGTVPAVLTSMVISIFPVVVNVATGLASTEPELEDVLRVLGARKRDILWNVGLPRAHALPVRLAQDRDHARPSSARCWPRPWRRTRASAP